MSIVLGVLSIDLRANTASFSQSMGKASELSAKTANDCKRSLEKMATAGLAIATGVAVGTAALIESSVTAIGSMNRLAMASGTTVEKFSALAYAAKVSHVEVEDMAKGMEKLAKSAFAAQSGNALLGNVFTRLGVSTKDSNGHLLDTSDIFTSVAVKFSSMADGAGKTALAMTLFGKAGAGMIPMLNNFGKNQTAIIAEAKSFGLVIGGEVPVQARAFHEMFVKLHAAQQGFGIQLTAAVLPALLKLSERLQELGRSVNIPDLAKTFGTKVTSAVEGLSTALEFAVKNANLLKIALEALVAIQIAKVAIPFIVDIISSGTLTAGLLRMTTGLLGLSKVLPLLTQFASWLSFTTKYVALLASEEGIAAAATYVFGGAIAFLTAPITIVIAAIATLAGGMYYFRDSTFAAYGGVYKLVDAYRALAHVAAFQGGMGWSTALALAKSEREAAEAADAKTAPKTPPLPKPPTLPQFDTTGLGKEKKEPKDVYGEEIAKLNQLVAAQRGYLSVLNETPAKIQEMLSYEKAEGIILEQNTKLVAAKEAKLTALQMATIHQKVADLESLTALNEYGKSLVSQQHSTDLSILHTNALAAANLQGDAAVRRAALSNTILGLTYGKTAEQLQAMHGELVKLAGLLMEKSSADQVEATNKEIYALQQELATRRLTVEAMSGSEDALRDAALAVKLYAIEQQIANETDTKALVALRQKRDAIIALDSTENDAKNKQAGMNAEDAMRSPEAQYKKDMEHLANQKAALEALQGGPLSYAQALILAGKEDDAFNKKLEETVRLLLNTGGAREGVAAFFLDIQKQAISTASIIYEALHSAFDRLADNMTELITGGKTNFGKMLEDIGKQMLNSAIKQQMQKGLAALGEKLGFSMGKPDGSSASMALWVRLAPSLTLPVMGAAGTSLDMSKMGGLLGGSMGGGIFSFLGKLLGGKVGGTGGAAEAVTSTLSFPGMAGGGTVSADKAYLVGENGPEILRGATGRISSNAESRRMFEGRAGASYYIDARGTDPALTEQRVKTALVAVHGSAVSTSLLATREMQMRVPQT